MVKLEYTEDSERGILNLILLRFIVVFVTPVKGRKQLSIWLHSSYCNERGITPDTVALVVRQAIEAGQKSTGIVQYQRQSMLLSMKLQR